MDPTRRNIARGMLGLVVAGSTGAFGAMNQASSLLAGSSKARFKLGIGSYTYRSLSPEEMVRRLKQMKIDVIELSHPQFWAGAKNEDFASAAKLFKTNGIRVVSWFGPEIKNAQDVQRVVELAKILGVQHVSGDASGDGLKAVDEAFQKNNLYYGIHNHFFKRRKFQYESPEDILKALSATSQHVGSTLDTGHMTSCGYDPVDAFLKLKDRIRVIHLKDIEAPGNDQNVVFGTGKAKPDAVVKTLLKEGYAGLVAIEYEEEKNLQPDVEKCVQFVRARL
jgi:sugar phosphate isomerase/epimerase